jgi:hypothetical protein
VPNANGQLVNVGVQPTTRPCPGPVVPRPGRQGLRRRHRGTGALAQDRPTSTSAWSSSTTTWAARTR